MSIQHFTDESIQGFFLTQTPETKKQAQEVAAEWVRFIEGARYNLHIAIYDFRLDGELATTVVDALKRKAKQGLMVRIAFHKDTAKQANANSGATHLQALLRAGGDLAPSGTEGFLQQAFDGTRVDIKGIDGHGHLMHDKYVIRDAMTPHAAVWTGSTNFTKDAWSLQENNVLILQSRALCRYYETDFWELWSSGSVVATGAKDQGRVEVGTTQTSVWFSPGEGAAIDAEIAKLIGHARKRVAIASMVISSGHILGALNDLLGAGHIKVSGIFDRTQMQGVVDDWKHAKSAQSQAKLQLFEAIAPHLHAKSSTPYTPTSAHDFMHNKLVVVDDAVLTGSFNFSNNAISNAENALLLVNSHIADRYAAYVSGLLSQYPHRGLY